MCPQEAGKRKEFQTTPQRPKGTGQERGKDFTFFNTVTRKIIHAMMNESELCTPLGERKLKTETGLCNKLDVLKQREVWFAINQTPKQQVHSQPETSNQWLMQ